MVTEMLPPVVDVGHNEPCKYCHPVHVPLLLLRLPLLLVLLAAGDVRWWQRLCCFGSLYNVKFTATT